MVSIRAALTGASGISIGNVVGSNIANVLLVLGVPALIYPTLCDQVSVRRNTVFMVSATIIFIFLCLFGELVFWQGLILFTSSCCSSGMSRPTPSTPPTDRAPPRSKKSSNCRTKVSGLPQNPFMILLFLAAGVLGLPLGAHFIVDGGTDIARAFGVSDSAIGLSLIAFGTSLPELATTVIAALRRQADIAVGNVLGSNLFNILGVMGITAMVAPIEVPSAFIWFDLWVMLIAALLVVPFAMAKGTITRSAGAFFLVGYVAYLYFLFVADRAATMHAV